MEKSLAQKLVEMKTEQIESFYRREKMCRELIDMIVSRVELADEEWRKYCEMKVELSKPL